MNRKGQVRTATGEEGSAPDGPVSGSPDGTRDLRGSDIAIVGMAVRFPGADDLDAFCDNLGAGFDAVRAMPESRARATGLDPAAEYLPMGYLDDVHTFDHAFFGLTRHEAALIDPQHRIALTLAHQAIEDAGQNPGELRGRSTAVVFGATPSGYGARLDLSDVLSALGNAPFGLTSRIAHTLGLDGPCYSLDSGCNGSLLAVRLACRELAAGDAEYALAGGVSVRPDGVTRAQVGGFAEIASSSDRCRPFDAAADGTVAGEGGAALLLTTLARARAEHLPVHAVIRGAAARHNGGAAATISAPSAAAHAEVIRQAWHAAGVDPEKAGFVEAHGSGTTLGDAVELEGLGTVFRGRSRPLPVGAVKSAIGHLDNAAGVAGLVKAVLSVRNAELYPSLHFTEPAPGVDLRNANLEMITEARSWDAEERLAGVSSFSLGGANAHCVVQQPPTATVETPDRSDLRPRTRLVGVSARSRSALARLCADLAVALRGETRPFDDVVYTLNNGRTHYEQRVSVSADSTDSLALQLEAQATWLADEPETDSPGRSARAPKGRPQLVLLLSPESPGPVPDPAGLPPELPATGATFRILSTQLAAVTELRRRGISPDAVVGAGVSRYLARYLRDELTPTDTADLAAEKVPGPPDPARLAEVISRLLDAGPAVVVDLTPDGSLGALLREGFASDARVRSHTIAADDSDLLGVLGALYEGGTDLDWSAIGPPAPRISRVRLPGHPMKATPCWIPWSDTSRATQTVPETAVADRILSASSAELADTDHAPPASTASDTTRWLCHMLGDLLGTPAPTPDSDFFDLGGNSLIALQVINRVEERFGMRHRLLDLYEYPAIEDFARFVQSSAGLPTAVPGSPAPKLTGSPARPELVPTEELMMSFGQDRMWLHHEIDKDTTLYNWPMVRQLDGPLDVEAFGGMWHDFVMRHETLRSNFIGIDGVPELQIRPDPGDFFAFADVSDAPDPQAAARELVARSAQHRFDLAADPLMRVLLVRLAPERHVLQLTTHHAVNDGHSPRILCRELPEMYTARREGRPARLPDLPIRYRDYALWQRRLLASSSLDHEIAYWRKALHDAPRLNLPTDHPRPTRRSFTGDMLPFTIETPVVTQLRRLATEESVTLFVVLLSAFNLLLARLSGQQDLIVATPTSGRNHSALQGMIGYVNSTVALRCAVPPQAGLGDYLRQTRATVLDAIDHQEIPFDRVVSALRVKREAGRDPLIDVSYVHQEVPHYTLPGISRTSFFDEQETSINLFEGMPVGTAKYDLTLLTSDREGRSDLTAGLEYSTELFTADTANGFVGAYQELLRALAQPQDTERPIASLLETSAPLEGTEATR